jgi:CheY-like chemotaxis protein
VYTSAVPLILYVDDDTDDFYFFKESLIKSGSKAKLVGASNGEEAVHYLLEIKSREELPSLIILDLNMPRWDGRQTLRYLKENPPFTDIPVIILSTSENKTDRETCVNLGAVSYVQKPNHFEGYHQIIENCLDHMHHLRP